MIDLKGISNLVFEGGGVDAIAYAGFIIKAEELGLFSIRNIKRVAGVSSGAITGLQVALNYTVDEIVEEMKKIDFKIIANGKHSLLASALRFLRFIFNEGFYTEKHLYQYIGKLIKTKTGNESITFQDLQNLKHQYHYKDLYIITTKLFMINNQPLAESFVFSHEHTPHTRVIDAICASAALPIIFPPMRLLQIKKGQYIPHAKGNLFVDGGIIRNYPIRIFDYLHYLQTDDKELNVNSPKITFNQETLGLRLESSINFSLLKERDLTRAEQVIGSRLQYAEAILYVLKKGQQETFFEVGADQFRSIIIDTLGISSTDFDITPDQKKALLNSGIKAAIKAAEMVKVT